MNEQHLHKKLHLSLRHCVLCAIVSLSVILAAGLIPNHAKALYILTGADDTAIVLDKSASVKDFSSQLVYLSTNSTGFDVTLAPNKPITIMYDGKTMSTTSKRENISALLGRMGIEPGPLDMVAVDLSANRVSLTVGDQLTYYDRVTETVPHKTVRVPNPSLPKGTEKVTQTGADGQRTSIYEVVWSCGKMVSRQFVEEVNSTVRDEIVEYGTAAKEGNLALPVTNVAKNPDGSGVLTLSDGTKLNFSSSKRMTATAYTAGHGGADLTTATGTFVNLGTVAVDRRIIPLGTRMYIVADGGIVYGLSVAADTGVRGNVVDLYHKTYLDCINFGRRGCTVYILE